MTEAMFQSKFTKWLKANCHESAAYELKLAKGRTLPLSRIAEHQLVALERVAKGTLAYKISDSSIGYKPFDCFTLCQTGAYLVVMFYVKGERQRFHMIPILPLLEHFKTKRSLKEEDCKRLGTEHEL